VPHRDEYSETVGYFLEGPSRKVLFIPDIDKWEKWDISLIEALSEVDYALLDATFYGAEEVENRDISEIPHPFITETMAKLSTLSASEKMKIYFIHFNHTNPVLNADSEAYRTVISNGFNIAKISTVMKL
jgi:pyrroloquinoline quinone biosynthesis protein B